MHDPGGGERSPEISPARKANDDDDVTFLSLVRQPENTHTLTHTHNTRDAHAHTYHNR